VKHQGYAADEGKSEAEAHQDQGFMMPEYFAENGVDSEKQKTTAACATTAASQTLGNFSATHPARPPRRVAAFDRCHAEHGRLAAKARGEQQ